MKQINNKNKTLLNGRIDYSKISGMLPVPNLVKIQTDSYHWFLSQGIEEVFREVFPISSYSKNVSIEYVSYRAEQPKYTPLECKSRGFTYSSTLRVTLRLTIKETREIKESEIFMGELPRMTEAGTFIINGAERVIVSQIVRSPGAYMSERLDKSGQLLYTADLNPSRGTWLKFESSNKGLLFVQIDRQRKMNATVLLKALGVVDHDLILDLFDAKAVKPNKKDKKVELSPLAATLEKDKEKGKEVFSEEQALKMIFAKLKPGEPISEEGVLNHLFQKFFDPKRYDLGQAGRYKFAKKLGIYERLVGVILAENLVDAEKNVVFEKGHVLTKEQVDGLRNRKFFEGGFDEETGEITAGAHVRILKINERLDNHNKVNVVKVFTDDKKTHVINIVGTDLSVKEKKVTIADIVAVFSYFINIQYGLGRLDDIDHLSNRRVRCVGELIQNQFRVGLSKMAKAMKDNTSVTDLEKLTPQKLVNIRHVSSAIRDFFATSQLSQFMDQVNPLAELTNKRRLSALGPGGLTRDRASFEVRDVHYSHYGRICPIETPEGQNIGLINNLACYAQVNEFGFLETPYRKVIKPLGQVTDETVYFAADTEKQYTIAEANVEMDENGVITNHELIARRNGVNVIVTPAEVDYIDVSPKQIVSIAAASIPFLENDDAMRALMGANMQRQALPLLRPESPLVGTGLESIIAHDSGASLVAPYGGVVKYVDSKKVVVVNDLTNRENDGIKEESTYDLVKFARSNQGSCYNQMPIVKVGQTIKDGDVIADGPAMEKGELALGRNVTIAFMTWNGYNFEDAVIMSERLVKEDVYTSIHIEEHKLEARATKLGDEVITRDIPGVSELNVAYLDENGIIVPGAEVKEGDILVGRVTPKGQTEPTPEDKLLQAIFSDKAKEGKNTSLTVPHGGSGTVLDVKIFTRENGDELPPGVNKTVIVYIVQKRKISEGDKMSGRHGNKGVISRILPENDMPFMEDGTPVDIMLNPLGVPSRMNIGQILEIHLGMAAKKLGIKIATPVFDGITNQEILELMEAAKMKPDGKEILFDGRTGERFDERISVGVMYMIKLVHMVDDKLHARATGPYSLVTQQPLGGKAQNGGQRFGEMEVWALEAYGAANTLQEILTIKSDDRVGRKRTYESIVKGLPLPKPGIPEAFKVLTRELQGLAIDVELIDNEGEIIDLDELAKDQDNEIRRSRRANNVKYEREDEEETVEQEEFENKFSQIELDATSSNEEVED